MNEDDPKTDPSIRHRNPHLLLGLLGYLEETGEPIPWDELVEVHTSQGARWKTVENAVYDLLKFGACSRIGKPARRSSPDTRAVRITPLGLAWLNRELLPLPGAPEDEDEASPGLLTAETVAKAFDIPDDLLGDVSRPLEGPTP